MKKIAWRKRKLPCAGMPLQMKYIQSRPETVLTWDSFNTQTSGRIASILMMEDTPENFVTCVPSHAGLTTDAVRLRDWQVPSRVTGLLSITVTTILRMRLEVWMGQLT